MIRAPPCPSNGVSYMYSRVAFLQQTQVRVGVLSVDALLGRGRSALQLDQPAYPVLLGSLSHAQSYCVTVDGE